MSKVRIFLAGALMAAAVPAAASTNDYGYISEPMGMGNGAVLFFMSSSRTTPASCGSSNPTRWAINATTTTGQSQLSVLMTAYAMHKRIYVNGLGTCSGAIWSDTETVDWFVVEN